MVGKRRRQPNGDSLYEYTNGSFTDNITIPGAYGAFSGTTYIYRGIKVPQQAQTYACGQRCIKMWAHRSIGHGENSTFFECPITVNNVSNVSNAADDSRRLPDDMARLVAASIALQGRPSIGQDDNIIWPQYQLYVFG